MTLKLLMLQIVYEYILVISPLRIQDHVQIG